jgi:hypothetical protein
MYDDFKGKSKKIKPNNEDGLGEDDDIDLGEGGMDDSLIDEIFDDEGDIEDDNDSYEDDGDDDEWDNGFTEEDGNY